MTEETLSHIFEPFYTTKKEGKGTGLGLSMAYGIIKQSAGSISAFSVPGTGTVFTIYLPITLAKPEKPEPDAKTFTSGHERIFLVEDESTLRTLLKTMLLSLGYQVSTAASGPEALSLIEEQGLKFDLIITDVMMPGMSGFQLVNNLHKKQADLKVLYISGYVENTIPPGSYGTYNSLFLQKPFNIQSLSEKVHELLGRHITSQTFLTIGDRPQLDQAQPEEQVLFRPELILVADDHPINQEIMILLLKAQGFVAHAVASGQGTLEALASSRYSLVLMDIEMPDMSGFEATRLIRQTENDTPRHLPIIAMTGHTEEGSREKCLSSGMDDFLTKPIDSEKLEKIIEKWLPPTVETPETVPLDQAREESMVAEPIDLPGLSDKYGPKNVQMLLRMFLDDARKQIVKLRQQAQPEAKPLELLQTAHGLKGVCGVVFANQMRQTCVEIEESGRNRNWDLLSSLIQKLDSQFEAVQGFVKDKV